MTLPHLKSLCVVAMSVALTGGGFGLYAIHADDKKPTQPGEKPVKPDGEKKPVQFVGKVSSVDAKANTITLVGKGDTEKVVMIPAGVKVFIDNKESKLADIPKGSFASFVSTVAVKGVPAEVTEVRVAGPSVPGIVKQVDAASLALDGEKNPRTVAITAGTQVTVNGKPAKATDLKVGDKVMVALSADEKTALSVSSGVKSDGDKPVKTPAFGGKVSAVDATAKTITVTTGKGDNIKETVVKLTADAKVIVDGKDVKITDVPKGLVATFTLVPTKDGEPRQATAVVVNGPSIEGTIKQADATSITLNNVKAGERVIKLLPATKVTINGKDAKATDLKVGDKVAVTLMADESGAVSITSGDKPKPTGDKPKPGGDK